MDLSSEKKRKPFHIFINIYTTFSFFKLLEGVNYIEKKKQQVQYLYKNPCVAKRKGINIS